MKKAGVDLGATFVKTVWHDEDFAFMSTTDSPLEEITNKMLKAGVVQVNISGINQCLIDQFDDFAISHTTNNIIENEKVIQAHGSRKILKIEGITLDEYLLVSIGTGTTYTQVSNDKIIAYPFGNCIGGGFISGLGKLLGAKDFDELRRESMKGNPADIFVRDIAPSTKNTFEGGLVVANFGAASRTTSIEDAYATIFHTAATAIIKDILIYQETTKVPVNVVFVGTTLRANVFKKMLDQYSCAIGKKAYFPKYGEYSHAMGAYLSK